MAYAIRLPSPDLMKPPARKNAIAISQLHRNGSQIQDTTISSSSTCMLDLHSMAPTRMRSSATVHFCDVQKYSRIVCCPAHTEAYEAIHSKQTPQFACLACHNGSNPSSSSQVNLAHSKQANMRKF